MFMKYFRLLAQIPCLLIMIAFCLTSCDKYNYTDDLQGLGSRVEDLEKKVLEAGEQIELLNELILAINTNGYITDITDNGDGTYTIKFNTDKTYTLRNGHVGKDGKTSTLDMGVKQDPKDGKWYWTLNGDWLLDGNGNKMPAGAKDGQDGKDGKDGKDGIDGKDGSSATAVLPQVRINKNRYWEISTDGGTTWENTGISADGKDGKDGKADPADPIQSIRKSADGKTITFVLRDGKEYTVAVREQ
jgi:hypothetical protein